MSSNLISNQVEEYINYKRGLGFKIKIESGGLRRFVSYTRDINYKGSITEAIAFKWVSLKPEYSRWYMARRLEIIRKVKAISFCRIDKKEVCYLTKEEKKEPYHCGKIHQNFLANISKSIVFPVKIIC